MVIKKILLPIVCLIFTNNFYGQTLSETKQGLSDSTVFTKVDIEASFPGGDSKWVDYLQSNLNSMILVDKFAPDGTYTAIIKFIVRADGSVTDVYCENYPGYGVCEEGIRVIKKSKKWIPAQVNGKNVDSRRKQPISISKLGG